jgi:hypothetical protein
MSSALSKTNCFSQWSENIMEEQTERLKLPIVEPSPSTDRHMWYLAISSLFIVAGIIFAGKGWYTLYDNSYSAQIVGGDAYNFIIYATRGTALVCLGIVCAILSVTFAVFGLIALQHENRAREKN